MRRLLMNFDEFPDNSHFDPFLHNDYDFIHGIVFYFLRLCESPMNPVGQKSRERSAATWSTFPIINSLFLQYQDLIEFKWIEVLHDDLESSKIDGLALKRKGNSMIILIELAGGCRTNTEKKLESDCPKIYKNAIRTLKKDNKQKVFTVIYHENTLIFESLTKYNQYYVRERHLQLTVPQTPRDLKSFAALLPALLSWRQAAVASAE
ncbi:hypothetical protein BDB01DRAFT_546773 [Pilobolus umbonatus]|nr:hypothetical protein BDB01DRAFT_546773 [Pilobolus umbonatus]